MERVKGQLSQKPQRILQGGDPYDFSLKAGHCGQVSQGCPAAALGLEYIGVFVVWRCTTAHRNPHPCPYDPQADNLLLNGIHLFVAGYIGFR